ncbi:hypothetical protein E4U42_007390 [Claviceps africana]|uniref:Uncharacterized protein n=1 Tax=Claviceps africana TaxID=83212 RepID=A0A8K0J173_9HYPO|nr:hypothetical protein E4U42_007390 [Claviceps africana]
MVFVSLCLALVVAAYTFRLVRRKTTPWTNHTRATGEVSSGTDDASAVILPLHDFDWRAKEPTRYLPIKPVYHITMALQRDTPSDLITIDRDYLDRITLRRRLIRQKGSAVHGCLPRGHESVCELYTYLMQYYLPRRYPTMFKPSADGAWCENLVTGKSFPLEPPPLATAALGALGETVEEDFFLLHNTPEGHLCVAFMCCFSAGFDPSSKVGSLLKDIHSPVPSYDKVGASMERFFGKLRWTIQTNDELHSLDSLIRNDTREVVPDESIDPSKTLTRLPRTHAVVFSFKTYMYSIRQIKEEGSGPDLADAIEGLKLGNAPGMWRYKSAVRWGKPVCEYLRSGSAST